MMANQTGWYVDYLVEIDDPDFEYESVRKHFKINERSEYEKFVIALTESGMLQSHSERYS